MSLINNHFKTFLITLLSSTLLFSISCSNEGTTGGGTRTLSYYAGDWWVSFEGGEQHLFTINADGSVILKIDDGSEMTIPPTDITKNSDTSYTYYNATENAILGFNFTSDTKGTVLDGTTALNVTKK